MTRKHTEIPETFEIFVDFKKVNEDSSEFLKNIINILKNHNKTYWLDQGTLLGAVRDNSFIPWDSDIDISAWKNDFSRSDSFWKAVKECGYRVIFQKNAVRIEDKKRNIGWKQIDLHLFENKGEIAETSFWEYKNNFLNKIVCGFLLVVDLLEEAKIGPDLSNKRIKPYILKLPECSGTIQIESLANKYRKYASAATLICSFISLKVLRFLRRCIYTLRRSSFGAKNICS